MAKDAESHGGEDRRRKEEIDARNQADNMVYQVEKMLRDHRSKISDSDAKDIEQAIEETRTAMKEGGVERINSARSKLESASHRLAEAMYRSTAGQQTAAGGGGQTDGGSAGQQQEKPKDNVVDAEFVDVDDKNKK
jgi:molecular chaperone DnaK